MTTLIKTFIKEGLEYTSSNYRLRFNPEFHENQGKPFTEEDLIYLCSMYEGMKKCDLAMALGRTHSTILTKAYHLRKNGKFDHYKKLGHSV